MRSEHRELLERNLLRIQFLIEKSERAKECALLSDEAADEIHDLAGELLMELVEQ